MPPLLSPYVTKQRLGIIASFLSGDVLDLGCGYTALPSQIPSERLYVGIDVSSDCIKWNQENHPHREFYVRNLETDDLGVAQTFDTIVMTAIMEHLAEPGPILNQLRLYLKPDGRILVTTPTPFGGIVHAVGAQIGLFYKEAFDEHERFFDKKEMAAYLQQYDLSLLKYQRFLFGFNQLFVVGHASGSTREYS